MKVKKNSRIKQKLFKSNIIGAIYKCILLMYTNWAYVEFYKKSIVLVLTSCHTITLAFFFYNVNFFLFSH